jgi:ribosomal protein S18 acetylase RimI-like enzyme
MLERLSQGENMTSGLSIEILDLRHFNAQNLAPLLEAEAALWRQRLHWDYSDSSRLLMHYIDNHMLPGFVALEEGQIKGYTFCLYESTKAVIGDVFVMPAGESSAAPVPEEEPPGIVEQTLLTHLFELLLNSPHVNRVESQLLVQPSGFQSDAFRAAGFRSYGRLFMVQSLNGFWSAPRIDLPRGLELRAWREDDLGPVAQLICEAYENHPDSAINDQYRTSHGSLRFLNNIVRYSGCGTFSSQVSHLVVERNSNERVAVVLGSRISPESGHITQLCVHPRYRRRGLGRLLLSLAAHKFLLQGVREVSLTVTGANAHAIELYRSEGYNCSHKFDATVWLLSEGN